MLSVEQAQIISQIAIGLGIPALLLSGGHAAWKWITGRAGRERVKNTDLAARIEREYQRAEHEAAERRKSQEYASQLRQQMYEAKLQPLPWPENIERTQPRRSSRKRSTPDSAPTA